MDEFEMKMKKVCIIAQFPPPIHGLSKAVETLYKSSLASQFDFEKIDIKNNKLFLKTLFLILKSKADLFYFTISVSKGGNIRDLIILKILEIQKKNCVVHVHNSYYRKFVDQELCKLQRKLNYSAISKLAGAIVLSESFRCIFSGMLPENKVFVIKNCIDNDLLMSKECVISKQENRSNKDTLDILYLSNMIPSKGFYNVLELANHERQRVEKGEKRRYSFHFAGKFFKKDEEIKFNQYITDHNLDSFVTYHGIVTGTEKRNLLALSDIFILLTSYKLEGQPISIIEAMGNGLAVISTNRTGINDMVINGENGYVYNTDRINIQELYRWLITVPIAEINKIAFNGWSKVNTEYRESFYLKSFRDVFLDLA